MKCQLAVVVLVAAAAGCTRDRYPEDTFASPASAAQYSTSSPGSAVPNMPAYSATAAPAFRNDPTSVSPYQSGTPLFPGADLQGSYQAAATPQPALPPTNAAPQSRAQTAPVQTESSRWTSTAPQPAEEHPVVPLSYTEPASPDEPNPDRPPSHSHAQKFGGRDQNYRWISGTLDYVAMDHKWQVRYAPYSVENDRFGGSLYLDDDPRLERFKPGDIVYIEGELVNRPTRMLRDHAVYRIRQIRPVEPAPQQ